jgi:phosphoglycerate dehydrogenase-like enzyme
MRVQIARMKVLFHLTPEMTEQIFGAADLARLAKNNTIMRRQDLERVAEADVLVTGWGTPPLDDALLDRARKLKMIAHSAGSTKHLVPPGFWSRGIRLCSANEALGIGVAETTIALMIAGLKAFFPCAQLTRENQWKTDGLPWPVREMYQVDIGIIGASKIGRHLIRLLKQFEVNVLLYDPYVSSEEAMELGVEQIDLMELMRRSDVVSLHAPALESTRKMLKREHFRAMKNHALFINTARGMIIDEEAMVEELKTGRIFAFIDVTNPEPPKPDHPFRTLPNCVLLPHIAGAISNGCRRQGRSIVDQIFEFESGKTMHGEIVGAQWKIMA